jgi:hypothetical protein
VLPAYRREVDALPDGIVALQQDTAEATTTKDATRVTSLDQYSRTSQKPDSSTALSL